MAARRILALMMKHESKASSAVGALKKARMTAVEFTCHLGVGEEAVGKDQALVEGLRE